MSPRRERRRNNTASIFINTRSGRITVHIKILIPGGEVLRPDGSLTYDLEIALRPEPRLDYVEHNHCFISPLKTGPINPKPDSVESRATKVVYVRTINSVLSVRNKLLDRVFPGLLVSSLWVVYPMPPTMMNVARTGRGIGAIMDSEWCPTCPGGPDQLDDASQEESANRSSKRGNDQCSCLDWHNRLSPDSTGGEQWDRSYRSVPLACLSSLTLMTGRYLHTSLAFEQPSIDYLNVLPKRRPPAPGKLSEDNETAVTRHLDTVRRDPVPESVYSRDRHQGTVKRETGRGSRATSAGTAECGTLSKS